jgi:hypothetical protein
MVIVDLLCVPARSPLYETFDVRMAVQGAEKAAFGSVLIYDNVELFGIIQDARNQLAT